MRAAASAIATPTEQGTQTANPGVMSSDSAGGVPVTINIAEMTVRSDDDIRRVSQVLHKLIQTGSRAMGRV